jgi:hypothetical protein
MTESASIEGERAVARITKTDASTSVVKGIEMGRTIVSILDRNRRNFCSEVDASAQEAKTKLRIDGAMLTERWQDPDATPRRSFTINTAVKGLTNVLGRRCDQTAYLSKHLAWSRPEDKDDWEGFII